MQVLRKIWRWYETVDAMVGMPAMAKGIWAISWGAIVGALEASQHPGIIAIGVLAGSAAALLFYVGAVGVIAQWKKHPDPFHDRWYATLRNQVFVLWESATENPKGEPNIILFHFLVINASSRILKIQGANGQVSFERRRFHQQIKLESAQNIPAGTHAMVHIRLTLDNEEVSHIIFTVNANQNTWKGLRYEFSNARLLCNRGELLLPDATRSHSLTR